MHCKLGAFPKYLILCYVFNVCSQVDLWLEGVINVGALINVI